MRLVTIMTAVLATLLLLVSGCARPTAEVAADRQIDTGVKVVGLGLSAAGYMLDFRYKVLDSELSSPMYHNQVIPYAIHQKTGARLMVPAPAKVGPLRQVGRNIAPGTQLFMMFANPGRRVQKGDLVTIVVGTYVFPDLVVQ